MYKIMQGEDIENRTEDTETLAFRGCIKKGRHVKENEQEEPIIQENQDN